MAKRRSIGATVTLTSVGLLTVAAAQAGTTPLFSGVVQSVDLNAKQLLVSGKLVSSRDAARVIAGQTVNVYGTIAADGSVRDATLETSASYGSNAAAVAGVTKTHQAGISVGGDEAEGISVGGTEVEGISVGGDQVEGISVGGDHVEGISVGGDHVEGISVGGDRVEGISVGGDRAEGISVGGADTQ